MKVTIVLLFLFGDLGDARMTVPGQTIEDCARFAAAVTLAYRAARPDAEIVVQCVPEIEA